ncbi:MAG: hypothetical protein ABSF35_24255 [Polyangia bacterium]
MLSTAKLVSMPAGLRVVSPPYVSLGYLLGLGFTLATSPSVASAVL